MVSLKVKEIGQIKVWKAISNIPKGKIKRFFKDNTLVNQTYIKDSKQSVSAYVKSVHADLSVTGFKRLALG